MSADLVAFLRAALDEDERVALEALDMPPMVGEWRWARVSAVSNRFSSCSYHPSRVLADIESKRRIVAEYEEYMTADLDIDAWNAGAFWALEFAVKRLAEPYASRPGYQESWRV